MDAPPRSSERLRRLQRIIAESRASASPTTPESAQAADLDRLNTRLDRILKLTAELRVDDDPDDEIAGLAERLLLDDYATCVEQLRARARAAEERLATVARVTDEGRQFVRRETKARQAEARPVPPAE